MEVIFYEKENGEIPVKEFLDNLDKKVREKALGQIAILERVEPLENLILNI